MRRQLAALALLAAGTLLGAAPAAAQTAAPRSAPAARVGSAVPSGGYAFDVAARGVGRDSASGVIAGMVRADISALRAAQDAFYAEHRAYAADLVSLPTFRAASGADVVLRRGGAGGWEADVTHAALPGAAFRATAVRSSEKRRAGR